MNENTKRDLDYVGNMAVDLYRNVISEFPEIHSTSITWLDHVGDTLTMIIYKEPNG